MHTTPIPGSPSRRVVLGAAALWTTAAVTAATGAPARAATTQGDVTGLSVELVDPTLDTATWQYVADQPVYTYRTGTVRFRAAAPPAMVLTNRGTAPVSDPGGTLEAVMWNHDYDAASSSVNYTLVGSPLAQVVFSPAGRPARSWTWTYAGTVAPGASVRIPLRYEVGSAVGSLMTGAFAQYRYDLFLSAAVRSRSTGEAVSVSEKVGWFAGTSNVESEL